MPIDGSAGVGIRPVDQPQRTRTSEGVQRREEGGSSGGFKPQTNVALKTAIDDMASVLSKISTSEKLGMEKLPSEVSQVVKNILQQAFSMESTLSQGIGSTLESQRFSMEQLSVFARMLTQIGALAEKGFLTIAFDPSFTGESSGEPRDMASPDINTEDFQAAVDFHNNYMQYFQCLHKVHQRNHQHYRHKNQKAWNF